MKASELRIGVYINWQGRPVLIKNAVELYNVLTDDINTKPIPLTEEWLLKLGFEYAGVCDALMSGYHKKDGLSWYLDKDFTPVVIGQDSDPIYFGESIAFVHQLQNLCFALTGSELTLKETSPSKAQDYNNQ